VVANVCEIDGDQVLVFLFQVAESEYGPIRGVDILHRATNTFDGDTGTSMKLGDLTASCRSQE